MPKHADDLRNSRLRRKRRRSLIHFFRKLRLRRSRKRRAALSMIFLAAVLYLAAVGAFKEAFLTVEELKDTQTILEYGTENGGRFFDVFRISVRIKSGEIIFFHQRTETERAVIMRFIMPAPEWLLINLIKHSIDFTQPLYYNFY